VRQDGHHISDHHNSPDEAPRIGDEEVTAVLASDPLRPNERRDAGGVQEMKGGQVHFNRPRRVGKGSTQRRGQLVAYVQVQASSKIHPRAGGGFIDICGER
jgi:hypothetical protein